MMVGALAEARMCGRVGVKKGIEGLVLEHLGAAGATEDWAVTAIRHRWLLNGFE